MQMVREGGNAKCRRVMLLGAGGHASDVLGVIERINLQGPTWDVVGIADDSKEPKLDRFAGRDIPFLGTIDEALARHPDVEFLATIGFPAGRRIVALLVHVLPFHGGAAVQPRAAGAYGGAAAVASGHRLRPPGPLW